MGPVGSGAICQNPAAEDPVRFDVPALLAVCETPLMAGELPDEGVIEIVVPISCWVQPEDRQNFQEFRFDIEWNRSIYPLADYSPRTLMQSPIEGVVAIEQKKESQFKVGVDAKSPVLTLQPAAHLEGGSQQSETTRFGEIPQHEMLVASGTIQRGTGAFFRYHPSRQFALEGGREVTLFYRVPRSWRAGILRVSCQANGQRKRFAGIREPVAVQSVFVVPVYLHGDPAARDLAVELVRKEQILRGAWAEHRHRLEQARPRGLLEQIQQAGRGNPSDGLTAEWASELVRSSFDDALERDAARLPASVRMSAEDYVAARQRLIQLSLPVSIGSPVPVDTGLPVQNPTSVPTSLRLTPARQEWRRQSSAQTRSPTSVVE